MSTEMALRFILKHILIMHFLAIYQISCTNMTYGILDFSIKLEFISSSMTIIFKIGSRNF